RFSASTIQQIQGNRASFVRPKGRTALGRPEPPTAGSKARDDQTIDDRGAVEPGPGHDETVPERVLETQSPPDEKHDAAGVDDAAGEDQADRGRRQRVEQRADEDDAAPAHGE